MKRISATVAALSFQHGLCGVPRAAWMKLFARCAKALGLTVLIGGCAAAPVTDEATEQTVAEILALPASDDPKTRRCLPLHAYDSVEILDRRRVLFSGIGDRRWLNELRMPCVGIRRNDTLVFRLHTSQVCSLDSFSALSEPWWWFPRTHGHCALGEFQPVTEHQVQLLREALRVRPRGARHRVENSPESE